MNILLKGGLVLQHSSEKFSIEKKDIYISEDKIAGIGSCPQGFIADKTVDAGQKLMLPGLINAHTHAYMTLLRNAADDLAFDEWLFKNVMPMEERLTEEDAYWGNLLGCMEMIKTGTTNFLDMHMFNNQTALAAKKIGMRAVISRGVVGGAEDINNSYRIEEAFAEMKEHQSDLLSFCLAPHAIYTCDVDFLKHVSDLAYKNQLRLNIHLSESKNEVDNCLKQHNMTPVELLEKIDFFKAPTIAAHCVNLTENDIKILKTRNVSAVTNPVSNMKLGNGFAPMKELLQAGINVCIGTDGSASNNTLNLFREMSILSFVHKGNNEDACILNALETFNMATINGARALGMEDSLGRIDVGMKADLSIINLNTPQLQPCSNLMSAIIYSMNGSEVESVIINGKFVMENNKFTNIDEEEVYEQVNKIRRRIEHA